MLDLFRRIFENTGYSEFHENNTDRKEKLRTATCVILLEAVTSDDNLSEEELNEIIELLKTNYDLNDNQVKELIETSKKERDRSPDLWYFTNVINETLSVDEKYELMEMVWQVIYSDGTLDKYENYIAHKLSNLLNLDHPKFIELKLKIKQGFAK